MRSGPDNLKRHEVGMRVRPRHRLSLCFKKSVDHDGLELARSPSAQTSGFATNDRRSGVDAVQARSGKTTLLPYGIRLGPTAQCPARSRWPVLAYLGLSPAQ